MECISKQVAAYGQFVLVLFEILNWIFTGKNAKNLLNEIRGIDELEYSYNMNYFVSTYFVTSSKWRLGMDISYQK